jgi:hypothetical protein
MSDIFLYPSFMSSGINYINISEMKLGTEKIELGYYFNKAEQ